MGKTLVICFSAEGRTLKVAKILAETVDADLYEIEAEKKYTKNDLDWMSLKSRTVLELKDPSSRPAIKKTLTNLEEYDRIYLGYPIWKFLEPPIIRTFLETYDLKGKEVALFCTSDQSGIVKSVNDIKENYPDLNIIGSRRFSISPTPRIIRMWTDTL